MGRGRTGLYPGTAGANSNFQVSMFSEANRIRRRGPTYVPGDGVGPGGGGAGIAQKLQLITPIDVLKKCMLYRVGTFSETQLVSWIQRALNNARYSIAPALRNVMKNGLALLKKTKEPSGTYDTPSFLIALQIMEHALEKLR